MTLMTVLAVALGLIGAVAAAVGITRIIRDPRRIAAYAYSMAGLGATLLSVGLILYLEAGQPQLLGITALIVLGALLLANLIGYPLLVGFLLWAGITTIRRESRSLANMLSLVAGIALLALPTTLTWLEPSAVARDDLAYHLQYGIHLGSLLLVNYIAGCFSIFAIASVAYVLRKHRSGSEAIIVLGAGLVHDKVSPLLAGRLRRGIKAQQDDDAHPVIITSGGQGPDEPRSEGSAMREYLIDQGIAPEMILAGEDSTTTEENLVYSQQLLPKTTSPVTVVTSSYHVFRTALLTRALGLHAQVIGASTAWYYLPGAVIREFAAVMRDHVRIHIVAVAAITVLTMTLTLWIVPIIAIPA